MKEPGRRVASGPAETYLIERDGATVTVTARDRKTGDTTPHHTHRTATPLHAVIFCEGVALGMSVAGYDVAWENSGGCTSFCRESCHGGGSQ